METWEQFQELFTGSDTAYGEYSQNRDPKALTKHAKPSKSQYVEHLNGIMGLGLVPVNSEGLCRFAAIDIDVDTIDHAVLFDAIRQRNFPLSVCRSKSGGAHLYLFMPGTGLQASQVQQLLARWAAILGYPQAEIFPKQKKVSESNHGNWINLPYFGGDATTRYAVGPDGAMTLDEFFKSIKYYNPEDSVKEQADSQDAVLPPCLARMKAQGVTTGYRNQALLNYAIFYRKSSPANWEARTSQQNSQYFTPPLDSREVAGVVTSAARTKYQYTCDTSPLKDLCDKATCLTLPFGVGHMPWQEDGSYDDLIVKNCRKLLSDPPRYIVDVNDKDITLTWEEFFVFQKFRSKIGQELNFIVALLKQGSWEQTVRGLLASKVDIEAPDDASMMGMVIDKLHEFLVLRERATEKEDILRGLPIQEGDNVLFRAADFKHYLQGFKLDKIEGSELFLAIRTQGATHKRIRLNGRLTMVWSYPLRHVHEQTEDFKVADFARDLEEEV